MSLLYVGLSNEQLRSAILERDDQLRKSIQDCDQLKEEIFEVLSSRNDLKTKLTHYESALKEAKVALEKCVDADHEQTVFQTAYYLHVSAIPLVEKALATISVTICRENLTNNQLNKKGTRP